MQFSGALQFNKKKNKDIKMILQSHNSWSYLRPKKWWMRLLRFTAKCQKYGIKDQYEKYGVRSFDLRVRFSPTEGIVLAHGIIEYDYNYMDLLNDLKWANEKGDCVVRVLHEVRNEKQYTKFSINTFKEFCKKIEEDFKNIKFYCGKNLYNRSVDYAFDYEPSEEGIYSSICKPKLIDDWFPWWFAKFHNHETLEKGTDKDILSIDFVNIR